MKFSMDQYGVSNEIHAFDLIPERPLTNAEAAQVMGAVVKALAQEVFTTSDSPVDNPLFKPL